MMRSILVAAVALAACGGNDGDDGSGGQGGHAGDVAEGGAGGEVAAPAGIWVVNERGAGEAGIDVIIHDASGAVVSQHQTDGEGFLDVARVEGQLVSVVWTEAGKYDATLNVSTVFDAAIDAPLRFVVSPWREPPGSAMIETILAPGMDGWDTLVQGSCWQNSMIGSGTFGYTPCPNSDTFDIVVYFLPGQASWQVFPGLTRTPGVPISLNVDKNLGESVPRIPVIASDLPADVTSVFGILSAKRPDGGMNVSSNGVDASESKFPELSVAQAYAPAGSRIEHRVGLNLGTGAHTHMISSWHDATQTEMLIAPVPLADVLDVSSDPAGRVFGWTLGEGARGDAVRVDVSFPAAGSGIESDERRWTLHLPATASEVTLPELPPSFAEWVAGVTPTSVEVGHVDAIGADGVAAANNARADQSSLQWIRRFATPPQ